VLLESSEYNLVTFSGAVAHLYADAQECKQQKSQQQHMLAGLVHA
jgi:hypothetical protein